MSRHITRMFCAVAAGFALTVSGLATACAASEARPSLSGKTAQSTIICCAVSAVAATSARNAWAVGGGRRTVILHWNGTTWKQVPSPDPRAGTVLDGVAATSAGDAWAVGFTGMGPLTCRRCTTLILHWNGTTWKRVPSPNPRAGSVLDGVAATSAGNAWAVGSTPSLAGGTLILRWNGKAWKRVPSPNPAAGVLESVAATSAGDAWAAGSNGGGNTLILHWTGTAWEHVRSPNPTPDHGENLTGIAATSARNAWVVGYAGGGGQALIARWNGVSWMT